MLKLTAAEALVKGNYRITLDKFTKVNVTVYIALCIFEFHKVLANWFSEHFPLQNLNVLMYAKNCSKKMIQLKYNKVSNDQYTVNNVIHISE